MYFGLVLYGLDITSWELGSNSTMSSQILQVSLVKSWSAQANASLSSLQIFMAACLSLWVQSTLMVMFYGWIFVSKLTLVYDDSL